MTLPHEWTAAPLARKVADVILWALAALPLALAALLVAALVSMSPANAAQDAGCGGADVLAQLKTSDPARYGKVLEEAAAVVNGKGIFWKIEKSGLPASWLLGTMHVTDPRVTAMPEGAQAAFDAAGTVIVESDEIVDERKSMAALMSRPDLTMFVDGRTIADFIDPQQQATLEGGLKKRGIPLAAVIRMKPWMLASFVSLPPCEFTRKAAGASFLDKKLATDAIATGKTLVGLETMEEQLSAMAGLPMQFHVKALVETLDIGDRMADVMATMTDLYLRGEIGLIMPMVASVSAVAAADEKDGYAAFEKRIVTDRNHTMATRAGPVLEKGNAFMAVGALHLPGDEGVVELLRQQGYTVTRVF